MQTPLMEVFVSNGPYSKFQTKKAEMRCGASLPNETREKLNTFSSEIRSMLIQRFGVNFEFMWKFTDFQFTLTYLRMDIPKQDVSEWLEEEWVFAYQDTLSLPNVYVNPTVITKLNEWSVTEEEELHKDWMIHLLVSSDNIQEYRHYLRRNGRLVPHVIEAYKRERFECRLSNTSVSFNELASKYTLTLGRVVLDQLQPVYNVKRKEAIQAIYDFAGHHLERCLDLAHADTHLLDMDDLIFHHTELGFDIEDTKVLPY